VKNNAQQAADVVRLSVVAQPNHAARHWRAIERHLLLTAFDAGSVLYLDRVGRRTVAIG
jgi:hypothetical protein